MVWFNARTFQFAGHDGLTAPIVGRRGLWLVWLAACTVFAIGSARGLLAQTGPSSASWRDGLKLLDSASAADIVAAESILRQAIAEGDVPAEAVCTLALVRLRQDEPADALSLIASLPTRFEPTGLESTRALALRIRLCAALMVDDAAHTQQAFKDLVRLIVAGAGDATDLRFGAITIGVAVGMLENDLAQSPISKRDLRIARDCMLNSKLPGVAGAYTSAYAQAAERAGELAGQFALLTDQGIEAIAAENEARLLALDKTSSELAEKKELSGEIFRNAREQTQQNLRDRRKLDGLLSSLQVKMRQPTPGHPGPQRSPPPPPPNRNSVFVNEYEMRTEYEVVYRDGQPVRIPVTREVRRYQADIDRERDLKYRDVMQMYEREKTEYDRYTKAHAAAMKSWTDADQRRREQLNEQMADVEAKRAQLIADNERIKDEQKDFAKQVSAKRNEKEQEEFEVELQSIALDAARRQEIPAAFRPRNFSLISWSQEKALLQRNTL